MNEPTTGWRELAERLQPHLEDIRRFNPEVVAEMRKQERREDPVTAHRMRLDGYAEARALLHEARVALTVGDVACSEVANLMLARATDLLQPEAK